MDDIIPKLATIAQTLNTMDARGKQNCLKLGGSIETLEEIINTLIGQQQEAVAAVSKHGLELSE